MGVSPAEALSPQDCWQTGAVEGAGARSRGPFRICGGPDGPASCGVPCPQACWRTVAGRGQPWLVGPYQHQGWRQDVGLPATMAEDPGATCWDLQDLGSEGSVSCQVPVWQTVSSIAFLVLPGLTHSKLSLIQVLLLYGSDYHFLFFLSMD